MTPRTCDFPRTCETPCPANCGTSTKGQLSVCHCAAATITIAHLAPMLVEVPTHTVPISAYCVELPVSHLVTRGVLLVAKAASLPIVIAALRALPIIFLAWDVPGAVPCRGHNLMKYSTSLG